MHRHGRPSAIDMDFCGTVLNGKVGDMACKNHMRGAGCILYADKLIHEFFVDFID
jgi:hypothetical protein